MDIIEFVRRALPLLVVVLAWWFIVRPRTGFGGKFAAVSYMVMFVILFVWYVFVDPTKLGGEDPGFATYLMVRRIVPIVLAVVIWFWLIQPRVQWGGKDSMIAFVIWSALLVGWYWWAEPRVLQAVLYKGVYLHLPFVIGIIACVAWYFAVRYGIDGIAKIFGKPKREKTAGQWRKSKDLPGAVKALVKEKFPTSKRSWGTALLTVLGSVFIFTYITLGQTWAIAKHYRFDASNRLAGPLMPDLAKFRRTPLEVAYQDLAQVLSSSEKTLKVEHVEPLDLGDNLEHFGFIAPIVPESSFPKGFFTQHFGKVDGFMVYDDRPGLPTNERIKRVNAPMRVGQDLEWFDSIHRHLLKSDWTAEYPEIYYIRNTASPGNFIAIAPKIEYEWDFPFLVPVWGGVAVVDHEGNLENLSIKEAKKDPRLKGTRLFPEELARRITEAQRFDRGIWSGWIRREGKIKIPRLPGHNQMPYYWSGYLPDEQQSRDFWLVLTEPDGEVTTALFRGYYFDCNTGERWWVEWNVEEGLLGPNRARERVKKIRGWFWVDHDQDGGDLGNGNQLIIEGRFLPFPDGRIFWVYTATTRTFTGITLTAVVDARSEKEEIEFFTRLDDFEEWLNAGGHTPKQAREIRLLREIIALDRMVEEAITAGNTEQGLKLMELKRKLNEELQKSL